MTGEIISALALLLFGFALVVHLAPPLWAAIRSRQWHETKGVILSVAIRGLATEAADGMAGAPRVAVPLIEYEYHVQGQRYRGTRINFMGLSYREAVDTVAGYHVGREVMVWYDPRNPASAVLDRYFSGSNLLTIAVGVSVFAVGLVAVLSLAW